MSLGKNIALYRKEKGMTQEALAVALGVTNQAVSKWEADACCPDIQLLPRLADLFGISLDALFGRANQLAEPMPATNLPWENDGVLRAVLYVGHSLILGHPAGERIEFCYEGPALNVESQFSVRCDDVNGNVKAGGSVTCDEVGGSINAAGSVTCDDVNGSIRAGGNVTCDCVDGDVHAGGNVTCDEVSGSIQAGGDVHCDHAEGPITANGGVWRF